jgi:hypothetical protein
MPSQIRPLISNYQQHQNYIEGNVTINVGTFTDHFGQNTADDKFSQHAVGGVTISNATTQNGTSIPGFVSGTLTNNQYKIAVSSASATATNGVVDLEKILQETVITLADNTDRDLFLTFTADLDVGPDSGNLTPASTSTTGSCLVRRSEEILPTVTYEVSSATVTDAGADMIYAPSPLIAGDGWSNVNMYSTLTGGTVTSITVTDGGSGYTSTPTVTVGSSGDGWTGVTATASVISGIVDSITVTNAGSGDGYSSPPAVSITGGGGTGAEAEAVTSYGTVKDITVSQAGSGNKIDGPFIGFQSDTINENINFTPASAVATVTQSQDLSSNVVLTEDGAPVSLPVGISSDGLTLENAGTFTYGKMVNEWYANITLQEPAVSTLTNGAGTKVWPNVSVVSPSWVLVSQVSDTTLNDITISSDPAEMTRIDASPDPAVEVFPQITNVSGYVNSVTVTNGGSGYVSAPTVTLVGAGGSNFNATAQISGGVVTGVTILGGGAGYNLSGTITFTGGGSSGATATYTTAGSDFITDVCEATINGVTVQCRTINGVQETISSSTATNGIPGEEAIFTGGQFWSDADDVVADINSVGGSNFQATVTGASSNQIQLTEFNGSGITIVNVQTDYGSARPGGLTDDPFAGPSSVTGLPLSTPAKTFNTELTNTITLRGDSTAMGSPGSVDVVLNINRGTETIVDTNPMLSNNHGNNLSKSTSNSWATHVVKVNPGNTFANDYDILRAKINGVTVEFSTFHGVTYAQGDTFTSNTQVYWATAQDIVHDINRASIPNVTAEAVLSSTNPEKYIWANVPKLPGNSAPPGAVSSVKGPLQAPEYFLRLKHSQGGDIVFDFFEPYTGVFPSQNTDRNGRTVFTPDGQLTQPSPDNGMRPGTTKYLQVPLALGKAGKSDSVLGMRQRPLQVSTTDQLVTVKLTFQ